jgi:alkylation response protein AidB-like acyl-CoA dehydrogenase
MVDTTNRGRGSGSDAERSFAEVALEMAGKSAAEATRTGAVDRADDQVESLYEERFRTVNSPLHRAVWSREVPVALFDYSPPNVTSEIDAVFEASLDVVRHRLAAGTLLGEDGKISEETFDELGAAGYWGLLVDPEYGGSGAPFAAYAPFLARMAALDPTVAGMGSVHQCIGAVDPVTAFGSAEQKTRFLPDLAKGRRLSAFALTEPGAGSDLTALRTTATLDGDDYVVEGEKLFITNVKPGRTVGLVCLIDERPAVLVVELPGEESEQFGLVRYGLHALRNAYNNGLRFSGLRVPAENLLVPKSGDGLTIAYHGLNKGRVALCANAAGTMRIMAASMIPWAHKRETYGQPIATRELVQRRLARIAGFIVAAEALVSWTSRLLDEGYRGEMECVVAKIFGAEAEKTAAIDLLMKTHGGRSFLHGHLFGDYIHDFLAPSIYEGEGEMLGMALFKSLVKDHGMRFFEPMGRAVQEAGIKKMSPTDPKVLWAAREPALEYGKWLTARTMRFVGKPDLPPMPKALAGHAAFAAQRLQKSSLEISGSMRKYQLALADRQARMTELTERVIDATVILCTALYGSRSSNPAVQLAAEVMCDELTRRLTGDRPTDREFKRLATLGSAVADGEFPGLDDVKPTEILMDY